MHLPKVTIIEVERNYIYLRNILSWTKNNPVTIEVSKVSFTDLVEQIDRISSELRKTFDEHQDFILKRISEISGFSWPEELPVIYVYPIPFFNSFSHPLFLKICSVKNGEVIERPIGLNLGMLIHELVHNNMRGLPISREQNENLINFITINILKEISREYVDEYLKFHINIGAEIKLESVPKEVESGIVSVKDYYR